MTVNYAINAKKKKFLLFLKEIITDSHFCCTAFHLCSFKLKWFIHNIFQVANV